MKRGHHLVFALVIGVMLSIGAPAVAKGVDQVTITDGDRQMTLSWPDSGEGPLSQLVEASRVYDGLWIEASGQRLPGPPSGALGEPITLEWRFPDLNSELQVSRMVQYVYVDAAGGPIAHIPGGQTIYDDVTLESWFPVAANLRETLSDAGFGLASATLRVSSGEAHGKAATDDSSTWMWLVVSLAGAVSIAVLVQSGALRRRPQRTV